MDTLRNIYSQKKNISKILEYTWMDKNVACNFFSYTPSTMSLSKYGDSPMAPTVPKQPPQAEKVERYSDSWIQFGMLLFRSNYKGSMIGFQTTYPWVTFFNEITKVWIGGRQSPVSKILELRALLTDVKVEIHDRGFDTGGYLLVKTTLSIVYWLQSMRKFHTFLGIWN